MSERTLILPDTNLDVPALQSSHKELLKEMKRIVRFFGNDEEIGLLPAGFATFNAARLAIQNAEALKK